MKTRYRIVKYPIYRYGEYRYAKELFRWWFPFWCRFGSTHSTIEEAEMEILDYKWMNERKTEVVK